MSQPPNINSLILDLISFNLTTYYGMKPYFVSVEELG